MTEAEKKEIVALVMSEISGQAVDFDLQTVTPQRTDILPAVRPDGAGGYTGVTLDWGGITDELTTQAKEFRNEALQAKKDTELLKGETNGIKSNVEDIYRQFNEAVDKTIESVRNVYQSDLNAESTARQTADNTLQQNIDSETTTRESEVAELERVNAIQKYEIENLKAKAEGQIYRTEIVDTEAYSLDVPSSVSPYAEVQKIGGKSVVWNQLRNVYTIGTSNGITISSNGDGTINIQGTATSNPLYNQFYITETIPFKRDGRKYLITSNLDIPNRIGVSGYGTYGTKDFIFSNSAGSVWDGRIYIQVNQGDVINLSNLSINVIDLTFMFGSGNEPTLEECQKIFSEDYYPYDEGTIKSFTVKNVKSKGRNLFDVNILQGTLQDDGYYLCNTNNGRVLFKNTINKTGSLYCHYDIKEVSSQQALGFLVYYTDGSRQSFYSWAEYPKGFSTNVSKTVSYIAQTYGIGGTFKIKDFIISWEDAPYVPYKETTYDVSSLTEGLKSAGSVHDEWSNGKKIKRVGERAYTSGDESDLSLITDGTTTYYPLDTPTEETVPEIDNYIKVEGGGTLTFESDDAVHMPVPSTDRFVVDLTSTTEETI